MTQVESKVTPAERTLEEHRALSVLLAEIKAKQNAKQKKDNPVLKEIPKVQRRLVGEDGLPRVVPLQVGWSLERRMGVERTEDDES